jgi:hypothetical protein
MGGKRTSARMEWRALPVGTGNGSCERVRGRAHASSECMSVAHTKQLLVTRPRSLHTVRMPAWYGCESALHARADDQVVNNAGRYEQFSAGGERVTASFARGNAI